MNIIVKPVTISFDSTFTQLSHELAEVGFGVLSTIPLSEKFKSKGLAYDDRIVILEVCNPMEAYKVVRVDPLAANFLPCKLIIRESSGQVSVEMIRPTDLIRLMNNPQLSFLATDIETRLLGVLDKLS